MKCVMNNYVPHKINNKTKFDDWFSYYRRDLINMYCIFKEIFNKQYNDVEIENDNELFTKFVYMIFNSSSKHF